MKTAGTVPEYTEIANNIAVDILDNYNAVAQNDIIKLIIERVTIHRQGEINDLKEKVEYLNGTLNNLKDSSSVVIGMGLESDYNETQQTRI